ncbi:MAG: hypothetical protein L0Y60_07370 [Beijerinckiaceae bacterium]|nr:hypothetical protein [Beijerinckiaceae bacterium]
MELLITGGAFIGAILGRFFKVLVLIPVCALAASFLLIKCQFAEITVLESLACVGFLVLSLEIGYLTGLLSSDIPSTAQGCGRFRTHPRGPAPSRSSHWLN